MTDPIRCRVVLPCGTRQELGPGWTDLWMRPDTSDEAVIDEIWVHDVYRLRGLDIRKADDDAPAPLIVDLGANIGGVTCCAARMFPDARLIAVEPHPDNVELLRRNTMPFARRVEIVPHAVGGQVGSGSLFGSEGTAHLGGDMTEAHYPVPVSSLASLIGDDPVALVKCDIEGGEYSTFIGADLSRVDRIHMEWHGPATAAHLADDGGARYGTLLAQLAHTHTVQTFGRPAEGGMLFATRYNL